MGHVRGKKNPREQTKQGKQNSGEVWKYPSLSGYCLGVGNQCILERRWMLSEQAPEKEKYSESGRAKKEGKGGKGREMCVCVCVFVPGQGPSLQPELPRVTHLGGNGQASQGIPIQNVSASIVNNDVRLEFIQGSLHVGVHLLQVLGVLCAPLQLHFAFYGTWGTTKQALLNKQGTAWKENAQFR